MGIGLCAAVLFAGLLLLSGVHALTAVSLTLVVTVQVATGMLVWLALRRSLTNVNVLEVLGMGIAIGTVFAALAGVLGNIIAPSPLWIFVPTVVVIPIFLVRRPGLPKLSAPRRSSLVAIAIGLLLGLAGLVPNLARYPLTWVGRWDEFHRDMIFFEALGNGVARFGGGDSIFMEGEAIRYHWLVYAWAGQLTWLTNAEPFAVLTRVLPIVALAGSITLAASWTASLVKSRFAPSLAVALIVIGGYVGAVNGTVLNVDSPSQAMTTAWLLAFIVGSWHWFYRRTRTSAAPVLGLVAAGLTIGKVSAGVVAISAIVAATLVGAVRREVWFGRAAFLSAITVLLSIAAALLVVVGSASSGDLQFLSLADRASSVQGLNSSPLQRGVVFGTAALIMAMLPRWLGFVYLLRDRRWRWRPEVAMGLGMITVSLLAVALMSQGVNETWFALSTSAPLAVLSAVGLAVASRSVSWRIASGVAVGASFISIGLVAAIWSLGVNGVIRFWSPWSAYVIALIAGIVILVWKRSTATAVFTVILTLVLTGALARAMPVLGAVIGERLRGTSQVTLAPVVGDSATGIIDGERAGWSDEYAETARNLASDLKHNALILTNETDGFVIPALIATRFYMTGTSYQSLYGTSAAVERIPMRIALSEDVTLHPQDQREKLCQLNVTHVWISKDLPYSESVLSLGEVIVENDSVVVIKVRPCL